MEAAHNIAMRQVGGASHTIPHWPGFALRELHALNLFGPKTSGSRFIFVDYSKDLRR
ncbi:hypothetical protein ABIA24_005902 [Sinorhizobium fredii]